MTDRQELITELTKTTDSLKSWLKKYFEIAVIEEDYFQAFQSDRYHECAAELKVTEIILKVASNNEIAYTEVKNLILQRLMDTSYNPMNCTSTPVNVMNVYEASAWSRAYRGYFGRVSNF